LEVGTGRPLASHGPDLALNPASNAKLFTAAVALAKLGPDHRFATGLYGTLEAGEVEALVLRGNGDPALTVDDLDGLARRAVNAGLKRVRGGIRVDQSRFDEAYVPPAFAQQPGEWAAFRAPVSPVALEENTVSLNVLPATAGQPARVWIDPPGAVTTSGSVTTGPQGSGEKVLLTLVPNSNRLEARVGGSIAEGLPRAAYRRRLEDPRRVPGLVLVELLRARGVKVEGGVTLGGEAERSLLALNSSARMATLLQELGKDSDNFYAEMIFKAVAAEVSGRSGRSEDAAQLVEDWLRQVGAADAGTRIKNGSGLFDANRASALTFAKALRAVYRDSRIGPEFVAQLAVGGVDGTLRSRFRKHRETRAVRAKTGTLAKASALSGYVLGENGRALAFSVLVEGTSDHAGARQRIDAFVDALVKQVNAP
jgi:D-alanyl-D-alanine carboxypeptidase/D-alanyl-D-alanine-endopeptidase (penicillin-binding protein 4)